MASVGVQQTDISIAKHEPQSPETTRLLTSISARWVEVTRIGEFPIDGGGYADVWRGKRVSDGLEVAMKGLRINHEDHSLIKLLIREISIWSTLEHPNVLPFLGLSVQPDLRVPYLVSPWESYGNVMKYLESHEDADRAHLIRGVADGLIYLHDKGVVHGDIKGANILVASDGHPVLADFGLSVIDSQNTQGQTTSQTFAGSARWMAPERLVPDEYGLSGRTSRTPASDVYSFGLTIYEIYSGRVPFYGLGNIEASMAAVGGKRPPHPGDDATRRGLTPRLWTYITRCWEAQPASRPGLADLAQYLDPSSDVHEVAQLMANAHVAATPPPAYAPLPPRQHAFEVYEPCPFCDPDNSFGYVCEHPVPDLEDAQDAERLPYSAGWIPEGHSECILCSNLVPIRKAVKDDRCALCTAFFCENIYGSCEGARETTIFKRGPLQHLEDWFSDEPATEMLDLLTPYLFFGNRYEQQKLRSYLFEKGYTFNELLKSVAELYGDKGLPRTKWQGPALADDQETFQMSDWTCHRCALDLLEGNLFEWYMHQRQTDEVLRMLSPTLRPDCPKGTSCQDAIVDYRHATHFNHICLPTISQPLQAPSDGTGEGGRVIMKTTVEVKTFRAGFLPDQVTFRDRDGQPSFIVTCYDSDGVAATPGKATLWDWEWLNNARNQIRPHFDVYYTMKGYEYRWRGKFGMLNETESMEWVRCQHGRIPDGRTPVIGGKTKEGTTLHHAAVWWQTRRIPGKVNPDLGRAIIGFNGREIKVTGGYDVLCWK